MNMTCGGGDFSWTSNFNMSEPGPSSESSPKSNSLKRKRESDDEEQENFPPAKINSKLVEDLYEQPAHNIVVESSPYSTDEDEGCQYDIDFNAETLPSPISIPEPSCVLSPLENIARGDSTPHSNKRPSTSKGASYGLPTKRKCPLPSLSWADPVEVWTNMCETDHDSTQTRNPNMFDNHPNLQPRMRAILLDWLNEVCEVYKLHRETFHLAVEFVDRYLTNTEDVPKGRLQLIGITCLFIAAKVEEIYPPKVNDFAYVTDGACTTEEILLEEILILKILDWDITPLTINHWLNVYMQLSSESNNAKRRLIGESDYGINSMRAYTFVFPQYSSLDFVVCGQLVDLAVLHVDVNRFPYSIVAAAVIAHTFTKELALRVSGYSWEHLLPCYEWLQPVMRVLREEGPVAVVRGADGEYVQDSGGLHLICPEINLDESHRIQHHHVTLDMFDRIYSSTSSGNGTGSWSERSPPSFPPTSPPSFPPTPPASREKSSPAPPTTPRPHHTTYTELNVQVHIDHYHDIHL